MLLLHATKHKISYLSCIYSYLQTLMYACIRMHVSSFLCERLACGMCYATHDHALTYCICAIRHCSAQFYRCIVFVSLPVCHCIALQIFCRYKSTAITVHISFSAFAHLFVSLNICRYGLPWRLLAFCNVNIFPTYLYFAATYYFGRYPLTGVSFEQLRNFHLIDVHILILQLKYLY